MGQRKWHSPTHTATGMEKVYKREEITNSMYMTFKDLVFCVLDTVATWKCFENIKFIKNHPNLSCIRGRSALLSPKQFLTFSPTLYILG